MTDAPLISVIVPVHNGGRHVAYCLDALAASDYAAYEVIIFDDASTDGCLDNCDYAQTKILRGHERRGPAAARNAAAREASGDLLLFLDVDVQVRPDSLARFARVFAQHPGIGAVFGSYDDTPAEPNFTSQYKNLYHHFIHQRSLAEAATFWSGCGAITRSAFAMVGGFAEQKFSEPSIEDIELGRRLIAAGFRIRLEKSIQVKHLKRWTLKSLVQTDITRRAVPWSKLILESGQLVNDLNLSWPDRVSAALAGSVLLLPLAFMFPVLFIFVPVVAFAILLLNRDLYLFFFRRRGLMFAVTAFPMQVLYFLYSGLTLVFCCGLYLMKGKPEPSK
jgi:GT2 family glycosyltransferase